MKREVKFRYWNGVKMQITDFHITCFGIVWKDSDDREGSDEYRVLMQSTGLKDKNGKEIYEGDVCTKMISPDENNLAPRELHRGVIVFHYGGFCYKCGGYYYPMSRTHGIVNIIGNIYENTELLSPTKN